MVLTLMQRQMMDGFLYIQELFFIHIFICIILYNFTNKILIRETIKACRWNQASVASLLLACGSDVNAKTNGGLTAIQ